MSESIFDVIVIGLGPAGAAACQSVSRAGFSVLGLDKQKLPRYKPCAGGLTLRSVAFIEENFRIDLDAFIECKLDKSRIFYKSRKTIVNRFEKPLVKTIHRTDFDSALVREAESEGALIKDGEQVNSISDDGKSVRVGTGSNFYRCKYVVGCDGANGITSKYVNSRRVPFLPSLEIEISLEDDSENFAQEFWIDIGIVPGGYGWVFPKKDGAAIGFSGRFTSKVQMETMVNALFDRLKSMGHFRIISKKSHPIPIFTSDLAVAKNRVLLAGDSAGLVDPFLGEGIYYALLSGHLAGRTIVEFEKSETTVSKRYTSLIDEEIKTDLKYSARIAWWVYRFPKLFFVLASQKPSIFQSLGEALSHKNSYRKFAEQLNFPFRAIFWGI